MTKVLDVPSEVPVAVDGHRAGSRPFVVASGTDSTSLLRWIYPLTAIASGLGLAGKCRWWLGYCRFLLHYCSC